ncbi:hypothetical protein GCM10027340_17760 [Marinomonas epiphytica]
MKKIIWISVFGAVITGCNTTSERAPNTDFTWVETSKGAVLADKEGMTLYTFDKDGEGVSNCYGKCATLWPPALASVGDENTQKYTKIQREDGSYQWAYNGQPLYTWIKDTERGDISGDGVKGVWHIVSKRDGAY